MVENSGKSERINIGDRQVQNHGVNIKVAFEKKGVQKYE